MTGQNDGCWKRGGIIPCELGVTSPAGNFLPTTACLGTPFEVAIVCKRQVKQSLLIFGQVRHGKVCVIKKYC